MSKLPVPGGKIILTYRFDDKGQEYSKDQIIDKIFGGRFRATISDWNWSTVRGYYVPLEGYGDSSSEIIENDRDDEYETTRAQIIIILIKSINLPL